MERLFLSDCSRSHSQEESAKKEYCRETNANRNLFKAVILNMLKIPRGLSKQNCNGNPGK